jgi:hypothetical protein
MFMLKHILFVVLLLSALLVHAREYHVSEKGSNKNSGTAAAPFRTISKAADIAMAGDIIIVHAGTYREMIVPPRGGLSENKRIVYRAALGEKVVIKGSEIVQGWALVKDNLWKVQLPYTFFKKYNPFTDRVYGDWYGGRIHTGEVYLDGKPLSELDSLYKIMEGIPAISQMNVDMRHHLDSAYTWYTQSDSGRTTIYARFGKADPNRSLVEINVRPACFYPEKNNINYITISGFEMAHAASQWAAPTAEQPGLVGTNWSKGWIIENNIIHDAKCAGITLGKDRGTGDNMWNKDRSIDGSVHYNELVHRVIANGWNKDTIGSHIVRNNIIYNCGQAGICGSFGGVYSTITGNEIYDVYTYRVYGGAEMGGIKLHAAIDVLIQDNYIHNTTLGIWLDWMAQGTRVSRNLLRDNTNVDLFMEVNHGPYVIDNNIFLSTNAIQDWSEGGAFVHNLIGGTIVAFPQKRRTPWFNPHTTQWSGIRNIIGGDNRFYNNVFTGSTTTAQWADAFYQPDEVKQYYGLSAYDNAMMKVQADGNVYTNGANPGGFEKNVTTVSAEAPALLTQDDATPSTFNRAVGGGNVATLQNSHAHERMVVLRWNNPVTTGKIITSAVLGSARISKQRFENPDGTPLTIDKDFFGNARDAEHPVAGPFEKDSNMITVWPKRKSHE